MRLVIRKEQMEFGGKNIYFFMPLTLIATFYLLIYLFICLAASGLSCSMWDLHCQIFILVHGLSSCGAQAQQLWHEGLVAPQHVVSQFTDQDSNPCPLHCKVES